MDGFELHVDVGAATLTTAPLSLRSRMPLFLPNGRPDETTRVELIRHDTGQAFFQVAGTSTETIRQRMMELPDHVGRKIKVRLPDTGPRGRGHLNSGHFRLQETDRHGRQHP